MIDSAESKRGQVGIALIIGTIGWAMVWGIGLVAVRSSASGNVGPVMLAYNLPITWLFCIMGAELLLATRKEGLKLWPFGVIWFAGLVLLYFRLIAKTLDVSGHMTWLSIMVVHSLLRRFPKWFTVVVVCFYIEAAVLNFGLFGSKSSAPAGMAVGAVMALLLAGLSFSAKRSDHGIENRVL